LDPSAAEGAPAHVTVLAPFADIELLSAGELDRLCRLFAAAAPIEFSLARVARFPGVLYLAPVPSEPFVALTEAVWRAWPAYPPYRGEFDEVVPHLTVAVGDGTFAEIERELEPLLPIAAVADQVWLVARGTDGRWMRRETVALGRPENSGA
jgi:2'-5' RNA ligase